MPVRPSVLAASPQAASAFGALSRTQRYAVILKLITARTGTARGEFGVKDAGLVPGLDDDRLGGADIGEGHVARAGDGGHRGLPGLLLLLGGVVPRRERSGAGAAMGFVGGSREAFEISAGHLSMMPEGRSGGPHETRSKQFIRRRVL